MNKEILEHARALLLNLTPLRQDCGALCGGACCTPDEEDRSGMMLFPGERALDVYKRQALAPAPSNCGQHPQAYAQHLKRLIQPQQQSV